MRKNTRKAADEPKAMPKLGGGRQQEEDPKVKEERELTALLDLPNDGFAPGKMAFIEPEKWKNVGVSIVHALKITKEHQIEMTEYNKIMHDFTERFSARVFSHMK